MNRFQSLFGSWFKSLDSLGMGFITLGIVIVGAANYFNLNFAVNLGFACFGAGVIALGANAIASREVGVFGHGVPLGQRIAELFARIWGVCFILAGFVLFGYGIITALNPRSPILLNLRNFAATIQGTAVLLLLGSIIGILFALTSIFVSNERDKNGLVRAVKSIPGRVFGLILLLVFIALAAVSVLQILNPTDWGTLIQSYLQIAFP